MKRSGAQTRKRTISTASNDERPRGPLTNDEIAAVRRAYQDGCRGDIIIGMRGEERIITMLVPHIADVPVDEHTTRIREDLKKIGCDGMWRVCRSGPA